MRNIWTIARREYKLFFISPIAYIIAFLILLILGIIFYASVVEGAAMSYVPNVQTIIGPMMTIFLFSMPAITMRTLAEEQKAGTLEVLLTAPVTDVELVLGKWLGSFLFAMTIILITWIFPIILNKLETPGIDQGLMLSAYLGVTLMVASMLAIGVAASSLFSNQIAAFFATLGILLVLWLISYPVSNMYTPLATVLQYLDMSEHFFNTLYQGVIDLKDVIYYLSLTALSLFLGVVFIQTRRWR